MDNKQLLALADELLRTAPTLEEFDDNTTEILSWLGRTKAALNCWGYAKAAIGQSYIDQLRNSFLAHDAYGQLLTLLHELRHSMLIETGLGNVAVSQGMEFEYFDEIRKKIEEAQQELLFIDPYLDAEFVSRYLGHIKSGVEVRLLTSPKKLASLLPAAKLLARQKKFPVAIRTAEGLHDRYFFVDRNCCYQSGASFKDGAKNAPTTITQITDVFDAVSKQYEEIWSKAEPHSL